MKYTINLLLLMLLMGACKNMANKTSETTDSLLVNIITSEEASSGWKLLFNGTDLSEWKVYNIDTTAPNWQVENGCLKAMGTGGDRTGYIITRDTFSNFHLKIEFKLTTGANSGIFYGVTEGKYPVPYATGPEYQVIDNEGWPGGKLEDWQMMAADYAMSPAPLAKPKAIGEWNSGEIIVKGTHVEHWLNGEKVVDFERWTPEWFKKAQEGKWKEYPDYGLAKTGHIGLQDHGSVVYFRNIKIRKL